jgi:SAM-dependent methyltransferase
MTEPHEGSDPQATAIFRLLMAPPQQASGIAAAIDPTLIPPPQRLPPYARRGNFREIAAGFVTTAAARGLEPDHRVLELGCGVGRFAVGFAAFADAEGSYEGIDTVPKSIETCGAYIASNLPRFHFQVAHVFNSMYRPDVDEPAAAYRFPFDEASFDFVFSNSLFTHLMQDDLENYLREIGRVLRPGGRALNTFFLLNRESEAAIANSGRKMKFPHPVEGGVARTQRPGLPEAAIAYEEDFVREAHAHAILRIEEPLRYGSWSGREASGPGFGTKDIVVAVSV